MKLLTLNIDDAPYLAVNGSTYFLSRRAEATQLLPTLCPHRGGPLHLGELSGDGQSVICPWHDTAYKVCNLEKKALPTVRVKNMISVVVGKTHDCLPLIKLSRYH
jgi:nitrite reductase/ring-hydroxylating ferredoxin subunit